MAYVNRLSHFLEICGHRMGVERSDRSSESHSDLAISTQRSRIVWALRGAIAPLKAIVT